MRQILTILFCSILLNVTKSQTISPLQTDEYCPGVEYTFTATITKPYSSMIGVGGCYVTQLPTPPVGTTFTFKGKFADANQKQIFRIIHPDNTQTDFEFKKIKSLFYGTSCTPIQPNQTSITSSPCQVNNHTISFNNIQWGTAFESPQLCFGTITTYEYQLPSGWSIGANVSNGSNWIAGGNNVTVTSDLSTGNSMSIKVRPANNCGTGLLNNQPPAQISISRPKPTLTFTGNSTICSQEDFQAFNIPSWVTGLTWDVTPTTVATVSNPNTNPVTVLKVSNGLAEIKLTINSAQCGSYKYNTGEIAGPIKLAVGTVQPTIQYVTYYGNDVGLGALIIPNASYNWYEGGVLTEAGGGSSYLTTVECNSSKFIQVEAVNACGTSIKAGKGVSVKCSTGGAFSLAPNPANRDLTISSIETSASSTSDIKEVRIVNKGGMQKLYHKYAAGTKKINVNVSTLKPDVYFVQIFNGKVWSIQQIIIQH